MTTRDDASPNDTTASSPSGDHEEASDDGDTSDWHRSDTSDTLAERDTDVPTANEKWKETTMAEDTHEPPTHRDLDQPMLIAIAASLILPGLGHILKGFPKRGALIMVASVMTCCTLGVLNFGSAFDLYCIALTETYRPVDDWEFFPDADVHLEG